MFFAEKATQDIKNVYEDLSDLESGVTTESESIDYEQGDNTSEGDVSSILDVAAEEDGDTAWDRYARHQDAWDEKKATRKKAKREDLVNAQRAAELKSMNKKEARPKKKRKKGMAAPIKQE